MSPFIRFSICETYCTLSRITVDDVKLMVAATKKTTSWDGKTAYDVPVGEGKCVESFPRAVRLWCDFLGVKFKWR